MKVNLLYNPRDKGINGNNWKLNNFRFFREELPKHVELGTYPIVNGFDCRNIKADAVILWSLLKKNLEPMQLKGFEDLECVKITRAPDAWEIDDYYNQKCKELGIDLVVSFQSPNCQYEFLDRDIPYKRFVLGIDEETYKCPDNWEGRRSDFILSSGVLDSRWWFYRFRGMCAASPYVRHVPKKLYLGTEYWRLLNQYKAAIACMSYTSVLKYFEIPMCGCLMFAEVTEINQIREMGFIDEVNCIYIDAENYEEKFRAFVEDPDNPKWKRIADAGRKLVRNTYNNEREVKRFVKTIESLVAANTR